MSNKVVVRARTETVQRIYLHSLSAGFFTDVQSREELPQALSL